MNEMPGGQLKNRMGSESATRSELFPLAAEKQVLLKKGFLVPAAVVIAYVVALGALAGNPALFRNFLGLGLGAIVYCFLYRVCGKSIPWYVPVGSALLTMAVMSTPIWSLISLVFYGIPGTPQGAAFERLSLPERIVRYIISTGGAEEFTKILPVALFWYLGRKNNTRHGVREPLDGILIACASALGFVFIETLGEYGPAKVAEVAGNLNRHYPGMPAGMGELAGAVFGLETVIVRVLPAFTGHMAYSGYFGYFAGLAALKPKHMWKLLWIGYGCSCLMHGIWDSFCDMPGIGMYLQLPMSFAFYALLIAAVIKAREISPERARNFATVLAKGPGLPVQAHAAAAVVAQPIERRAAPPPRVPPPPVPPPNVPPPNVPPPPRPAPKQLQPEPPAHREDTGGIRLLIGLRTLPLHDGVRVNAGEIPGLTPESADGHIAAVTHNPKDPSVLGLQNLSTNPWTAVLPGGDVREVPCGKSIKLASGLRIDFGTCQGEVQ